MWHSKSVQPQEEARMSLGKKFIILTDLREGITTCHSRSQGEVSGFGQVSEDRIEGRV